ncbi:hypothetical protein Naga_100167g3 [Nannochloropsis gaditana]|uniref:Uncharacterized protein n=1 Tax=Nannochloropsis gaditana TaxID=72520 RepID=W7T9T1_9STRA|nr:hypothetical protein Naga_100167g3 [Nannochloropsis gaditana]
MGRTRSKTKAREHYRLDDGSTTMGGSLAFAAASEIVNEDYHLTEDENEVRAERKKAKDAEYQAHMKNGTWELTPLPKGERCISSGWVETDKRDQNGVESKEVELVYIPTQHQLADILTKPLSNIRLAMIRNRMMGYKS